jgi:hypothetical protein
MKILKYWTAGEFEVSSYKWNLAKRKNSIWKESGSDKTRKCTYTYNELGFRGDSIKMDGFKIMSLGCSHTEGVGVNDDETWPARFTKLVPNGVNMNFGTGGRSGDFVVRCLLSYYNLIKPDLVLIFYPDISRKDIYTIEGGVEPYMPSSAWGYMEETENGRLIQKNLLEIQNNNNDFANWYKNHLLIKLFLESKKCNFIWNGSLIQSPYKDEFRYDGDFFTNIIDKGVDDRHTGPNHLKNYSTKLYDHINTKFPHFLLSDKTQLNFKKDLI